MAATATSGTPAASTGVVVNVATDATLGKILTDGTGMTLYKYASDTSGTSTCSATCLANWPPLLATGAVVPDPSLTASDFSTTMTTDGRSMVTYKGSPLYHFKGDAAAGDTKGNGVGGVWSVVAP
jgi:predicted lipoprotein with Yx(FWY)xxD motif